MCKDWDSKCGRQLAHFWQCWWLNFIVFISYWRLRVDVWKKIYKNIRALRYWLICVRILTLNCVFCCVWLTRSGISIEVRHFLMTNPSMGIALYRKKRQQKWAFIYMRLLKIPSFTYNFYGITNLRIRIVSPSQNILHNVWRQFIYEYIYAWNITYDTHPLYRIQNFKRIYAVYLGQMCQSNICYRCMCLGIVYFLTHVGGGVSHSAFHSCKISIQPLNSMQNFYTPPPKT